MADIRITGRMVNFSRLTFDTNDHNAIRQQLTQLLQDSTTHGALVILDSTVEQELIALIQLLLDLDLQPMAVIDGLLGDQARAIQFPVLPADNKPLQRIKATQEQVIVETVAEQPMFRDALRQRRCLIPANGFYEWRGTTRKRPYWLMPGEGSSLFFAGIWEAYPVEGHVWLSTAVVTQAAATQRRPLILDEAGQHQRFAGAGRRNVRSVYGDDALAEAERAANPAVGGQDATGDLRGHGLWIGGFSRTTIVPVRSLVNSALLS